MQIVHSRPVAEKYLVRNPDRGKMNAARAKAKKGRPGELPGLASLQARELLPVLLTALLSALSRLRLLPATLVLLAALILLVLILISHLKRSIGCPSTMTTAEREGCSTPLNANRDRQMSAC
jgi:hypothetical protein